jgi:alkylation response protein AidB-like acyl-CoA dehydrogenase
MVFQRHRPFHLRPRAELRRLALAGGDGAELFAGGVLVAIFGEMDTDLAGARVAHRDMVEAAFTLEPGSDTSNRVFIDRTLVGRGVLRVAERAMEAAGGGAFYRAAGLERLLRDIQGVRYHRPQERMQVRYTGELALGLDPSG